MKDLFIPYEQALALKELGFNKNCLMSICIDGSNEYIKADFPKGENFNVFDLYVSLPVYQQAFRWFREKHELYSAIVPKKCWPNNFVSGIEWYIEICGGNRDEIGPGGTYSYEEAELACLIKLIEIVKNK